MTQFEKLVEGEKLSEFNYYSVVKVGKAKVQLKTDSGEMVVLDKEYVDKQLISSAQFTEQKTIGKTEAAALFIGCSGIVMTVNYNTQVKEKEAKEEMYALYPNKGKMLSEADFKKKIDEVVKSVITGEERTMIGRHYGSLNELGRMNFVDMEIEKDPSKTYDNRIRQVDPRTINWMIIKGVKYKVK